MLRVNEISTREMKLEIQACNFRGGGVEKLLTLAMNMNTDDDDDKTEVPPGVTFPKPTYV